MQRTTREAGRQAGFTLVELVTVIAIVAIVAGIGVAGRFADRTPFEARGFAPQLSQYLSAGQRFAVAQRRIIHVSIDPSLGRVTLCLDSGCNQRIAASPGLSGSDTDWLTVPASLRIAGSAQTFSYAPDGTPSFTSALTLRLTDAAGTDLNVGVSVEPGSGHARTF